MSENILVVGNTHSVCSKGVGTSWLIYFQVVKENSYLYCIWDFSVTLRLFQKMEINMVENKDAISVNRKNKKKRDYLHFMDLGSQSTVNAPLADSRAGQFRCLWVSAC